MINVLLFAKRGICNYHIVRVVKYHKIIADKVVMIFK